MGNGASRTQRVSGHDRAILEMKVQRDKLRSFQRRTEVDAERYSELARASLRQGRQDRARLLLQQKYHHEGTLRRVDEQLAALEQLTSSVEFGQIQQSVVLGLQQGSKVLQDLNQRMPIEQVEKIMEDSAEAQAYQEEISQVLAHNLSLSEQEAVEAEYSRLQELERSDWGQRLPTAPKTRLPMADRVEEYPEVETSNAEAGPELLSA